MTYLVYPPAWYRLETRELFSLQILPHLDSLFIAFPYFISFFFLSFSVVPYDHLSFLPFLLSPVLHFPL